MRCCPDPPRKVKIIASLVETFSHSWRTKLSSREGKWRKKKSDSTLNLEKVGPST
ncbi:hypothetical protein JHK87_043239 [Glycine soja]|nr:hypothetical protein JHK87_043239 [Glycine soja]